jgi:hypothetical protein
MRAEHRYDAHALIVPGEYARIVHGRAGLLRLVLSDDGPLTDVQTGHEHTQPDVFCHLTARQARQLADQLHQLADHLPTTTTGAIA